MYWLFGLNSSSLTWQSASLSHYYQLQTLHGASTVRWTLHHDLLSLYLPPHHPHVSHHDHVVQYLHATPTVRVLLGYHSDTHTTLLVSSPSCVRFLSVGFLHNDMITMKTTDNTRNAANSTTSSPIPGTSDDIACTHKHGCVRLWWALNYCMVFAALV